MPGSKIRSNLPKSDTFSDQISEHFDSESQNVLKSDLKSPRIILILGKFGPLGDQTGMHVR